MSISICYINQLLDGKPFLDACPLGGYWVLLPLWGAPLSRDHLLTPQEKERPPHWPEHIPTTAPPGPLRDPAPTEIELHSKDQIDVVWIAVWSAVVTAWWCCRQWPDLQTDRPSTVGMNTWSGPLARVNTVITSHFHPLDLELSSTAWDH